MVGNDCKSKYREVGFWTQKNNQRSFPCSIYK